MTDPLKLAEEIEERGIFLPAGFDPRSRLLAAALRLAEGMLEWGDNREPQTPDEVVRLGEAFAAYRAAREGSK